MLRVVFDTVIFVRCLINPLGLWGRAVFELSPQYHLCVSAPVLLEVLDVLYRSSLQRKFKSLAGRNVEDVLGLLADAEGFEIGDPPAVSRDPKDDKFLATAAAAQADYLVTEDQDLLVLREHQGTRIVTMAAFIQVLEQQAGG